jgi:hypothetical protein
MWEGSSSGGTIVLYDANAAVQALRSMSGETTGDMARALVAASAVRGCMVLSQPSKRCDGALYVSSVAADKGFGPLLYDFALSSARIMPDRKVVTSAAQRVWKYYYESRDDVEKVQLSDCKKQKDARRAPWLDCWYRLKQPISAGSLLAKHENVVAQLRSELSQMEVYAALASAGERLFASRFDAAA